MTFEELEGEGITEDQVNSLISKIDPNLCGGSSVTPQRLGGCRQGVVVQGRLKRLLANLKSRERRFVINYAETGNASESARRAGWSSKSGNQIGYVLLQRPDIRECIKLAVESAGADAASRMLRALDLAREMHDRVLDKALPLAERNHAAKVWADAESVLNELGKFNMKVEVSAPAVTGHFTAQDAAVLVAATRLDFAGKAKQSLKSGTKEAQESIEIESTEVETAGTSTL